MAIRLRPMHDMSTPALPDRTAVRQSIMSSIPPPPLLPIWCKVSPHQVCPQLSPANEVGPRPLGSVSTWGTRSDLVGGTSFETDLHDLAEEDD